MSCNYLSLVDGPILVISTDTVQGLRGVVAVVVQCGGASIAALGRCGDGVGAARLDVGSLWLPLW